MKRAYAAHIEILENVDATPEGFLRYANIDPTLPNTPPKVRIEVASDKVRAGDLVLAWSDSYFYSDDKTAYHYPGVPYWAGTTWDWGDGTPLTVGGPIVNHVYKSPGTYTVTMKLTDTENAVGTAIRTITVLAMP